VRTIAVQSPWDGRDKPDHDESIDSPIGNIPLGAFAAPLAFALE
jgi:hypothetical protein